MSASEVIAIVAVGLIAIGWYYVFVHRKKVLLRQMEAGISRVKLGLYGRLAPRFKANYGERDGGLLAAAVTNELFSEEPSNRDGVEFLASNRQLVAEEISHLRDDDEIRNAVTQAVRVKVTLSWAAGMRHQEAMLAPIERLSEFGILVPGGQSPFPDTFLPMAYEFYRAVAEDTQRPGE